LLAAGDFEITSALDIEKKSNDVPDLPRLVFTFDRQSYGLLRRLITAINDWTV